jgi:DNA-binding MarR family transcriptional regulator
MGAIASEQTQSGFALNEVFGSQGQIRLLRALATETDGFMASPEAATRVGMTPSGARKALRRLAGAGVVEKVGSGRGTRYVLRRGTALADEIVRLFELERGRIDPSWARGRPKPASDLAKSGDGNGNGHGNGNRMGEIVASKPAWKLDPESPLFNDALVSLLEEDLSLIKRAREKVLEKLEHRHPGNGHDDWEWRKILDTYPLPRLLSFLESDSPRAVRLRKSSPFAEVMSDRERERMGELVERVN